MVAIALTPDQINAVFASGDAELQQLLYLQATHPYYTFQPRPDDPNEFDEQSAFVERNYHFDPSAAPQGKYVYNSEERFTVCLGGTGSGKTHAAAFKTASHVLETPPPRDRCPFWVIGESFDQTCQATWSEKLSHLIPDSEILGIDWYKQKRRWPFAVLLRRPEADRRHEVGWVLEFKSYEQGMAAMKAVSIGGYWFNEEVPYHLVFEVQGRCRDYDSPGWADFTPIECRDPEWPEAYESPPPGWRFFHLNSLRNAALAPGFMERYLAGVPEDMRELRTIGKFTVLRGQVFKEFRRSIHVIEPFRIPRDWRKLRGIDFGFNNPFCCLWVARDHDGRYFVYDEHFESQRLNAYHAEKIHQRDWNDTEPWYGPTYSDHDPQQRAELGQLGIACTAANKSINPGIEWLRSLMMVQGDGRARLYIFDRCVNLIREILGYRWPEGTDKRNPQDVPMDVNNHAIDSLRYAVYSDKVGTANVRFEGRRVVRDAARHGVLLAGRK